MVETYTSCGRTRVLYASSFTDSFLVLTFLFINPRVLRICLSSDNVNVFILV